tara:strand:- start:261 stop:557 length:297 start_codon:yes stop_codon:yes gene_type:complete
MSYYFPSNSFYTDLLKKELSHEEYLDAMNDDRLEPWQKSKISDNYLSSKGIENFSGYPLKYKGSNAQNKSFSYLNDPDFVKAIEDFKSYATKIIPPME